MTPEQIIAQRDATIATLQEAVMLLKKRNYAKEDEIAALQARVVELEQMLSTECAVNECQETEILKLKKIIAEPAGDWDIRVIEDLVAKMVANRPTTEK